MLGPGDFSFLQDSLSSFCSLSDALHYDIEASARAVVNVIVFFAGREVDSDSPAGLLGVTHADGGWPSGSRGGRKAGSH